MGEFDRKSFNFDAIGIDLSAPIDRVRNGYAAVLENWRPEIDGAISVRPGTGNGTILSGGVAAVHSLRRLNDSTSGSTVSRVIAGAGTHISAVDASNFANLTDVDSGWSGDPVSMAIHQPTESVRPYCYLCDRLKMLKVDSATPTNKKQVGLPAPTALPTAALAAPSYNVFDEMDSVAAWTVAGTGSALATSLRVDPATRSITKILYDTGNTGWACVRPSSMADIGKGMRLGVVGANPETVTVQEVFPGSAQTTMAGIRYESGTGPGLAWIHLTTPVELLQPDSFVQLDVATLNEYVRVLAVERTQDGYTSFRCSTVASFVGTETVTIAPSFRAYFPLTHVNTDPLTSTVVGFNVATGTGFITRNIGAAGALDLSTIATGVPTQPDDRVHLSLFVDKPDLITEIKFYIDIDSGTTNVVSGNDFTKNYLLHTIRQNDFVPVTKDTQTALANSQTRYQRELIDGSPTDLQGVQGVDNPDNPDTSVNDPLTPGDGVDPPVDPTQPAQTDSGQNQYAEIVFRVSELLTPDLGRVGADFSRGLANVAALKIAVIAKGAVVVRVDGLWIGGGFGPDVDVNRSRIYRFRYRDSTTGVCSNWSPAMRGGVRPYRQKVNVTVTGIDLTANPEATKIDVAVYGGALLGWYYAGTVDNPGASSTTFADTYSEEDLSVRAVFTEGNIHYQLWPVVSLPVTGKTGSGTGTIFSAITGSIDLNTAPGTPIKIGGKDYTLYRVITTSKFETVESMGKVTAVVWEIAAPLIMNQRLPIFSNQSFHGFYFGLGDKLNPWRLYYTNGNDPDTTQDTHWIDIESEILQNILVFEGRCLVWSTERCFAIEPSFTLATSGGALFEYRELPDSVGLPFRYAMCRAGQVARYVGKDGIYQTSGGQTFRISDDIRKLFVHEGSAGVLTNGFYPVDMSAANANNLRLSHVQGETFFDYVDLNAARRTLVYRETVDGSRGGWRPYKYAAGAEAQVHYEEEGDQVTTVLMGGVNGKVYRLGRAQGDEGGAAIVASVRPRSEDFGDGFVSWYLGDMVLDYDTDGATINVTPGTDNFLGVGSDNASPPAAVTAISDAAGIKQKRIDFNSGKGIRGRNITALITASVTTQRPTLFKWQPSYTQRPETTLLRAEDYKLIGGDGVKFVRGIWIYADTYNAVRSATLEYTTDNGVVSTFVIASIQHPTLTEVYYPVPSGIYLIASRLRPTDANQWDYQSYRLDAEPAPPLSTQPGEWKDFGEARYVNGVRYEIDTVNQNVNMQIRVDEDVLQTTIQAGLNSGPVLANGRAIKQYAFDVPFITHLIRSVPSAACRKWNEEWITEPEPELAYMWWAQQTDCGASGFKIFGDGYISVRSTDEVIIEFDLDGANTYPYRAVFYDASTNSALQRKTFRFRTPVMKGKNIRARVYCATAAGRVAVFKKEFVLNFKAWGAYHVSIDGAPIGAAWDEISLLGDQHYQSGARI